MKAYRASLLYFAGAEAASAVFEQDGMLVVGPDAGEGVVVQFADGFLHQFFPVETLPFKGAAFCLQEVQCHVCLSVAVWGGGV